MATVHLLGANANDDTDRQAAAKNQIIQMNGYGNDRFVVHDIVQTRWGKSYGLINLQTRRFGQCDLIRPLSQKFGIGYYYDDENPEFMDGMEVAILHAEAEQHQKAEQEAKRQEQEHTRQLEAVGRERLQSLVPADAKAVIIAELHEDDSDMMTDYVGYHRLRRVILGFSPHTKDLFSEMRRHAARFSETAHLAEENKEYEHREKYAGGAGYYLGESKYGGWIVTKEKYFKDREAIINAFALIAGEEDNIRVEAPAAANAVPAAVTGNFSIVDYSERAIAVFGDTRTVKEELKASGGRYNPNLTHGGEKKAGWIFPKTKEQAVRNLLTVK
ncbi:MAG: fusion protein [Tannerella sp.]|jgi:hypothetical protein|nr:fusion protein [Tannerella sp.]